MTASLQRFPLLALSALTIVLALAVFAVACGDDDEAATPEPTEQQTLTLLYWQAPSIPMPYLSSGNKDWEAAAVSWRRWRTTTPTGASTPGS